MSEYRLVAKSWMVRETPITWETCYVLQVRAHQGLPWCTCSTVMYDNLTADEQDEIKRYEEKQT